MVSLFPHPASFRFHLTADTLAFGCILPTTGRIRDFHPLETCAARRTTEETAGALILHGGLFSYPEIPCPVREMRRGMGPGLLFRRLFLIEF